MAIVFNEATKTFYLEGKDYTYAFYINHMGYAEHLYFGKRIDRDDITALRAFGSISCPAMPPCNSLEEAKLISKKDSYHHFPTELSFFGTGDYRESAVSVVNPDGSILAELLYDGYEITSEKPKMSGMPSTREGETLILRLKDRYSGFACDLYYTVFEDCPVIARRAVYKNGTKDTVTLNRAYSFTLSLPAVNYDIISLYGAWARERKVERTPMHHGVFAIDSKRSTSSATLNPFLAVVDSDTTEEHGNAYGINLVYSSSFALKVEGVSDGTTLVTGGINDFEFGWKLGKDEVFETPEVLIAYSSEGIGGMSRALHDVMRNHLINRRFASKCRPIVINNWEATKFNFDTEKLKGIAKAVQGTGIDTFVLDDGWFGDRSSDRAGLGDWVVNTDRLEGGLTEIIKYVHSIGMKFGLWFEPEMVNEDSDLYRAHPDYAIAVPGRPKCYSRYQFVLDLTRADVRNYIVDAVNKVLSENDIDYVKWDYNRNVTEFFSIQLDKDSQREFAHRYALGLYDIFERIVEANPNVFFEGCAGGGARFDPAVLYYFPQIWTSDDTDVNERTYIQYGTSIAYPLSAMSCHFSDVPNHQTTRVTPRRSRSDISHLGATGYELDTTKFTDEDKELTRKEVEAYIAMQELIINGDLYRTEDPFNSNYFGFMVVSKDKTEAVLTAYRELGSIHNEKKYFKVRGLDESKRYTVTGFDCTFSGATLMSIGLPAALPAGDYRTAVYTFKECK